MTASFDATVSYSVGFCDGWPVAVDNPRATRTHFYAIDAFRFCAALSVATCHLFFALWAIPPSDVARISQGAFRFEFVGPYMWFLYISVEILFVVSGMVIPYSANGSSTGKFIKGRLLRLYPAPWICAPITFVMICFVIPNPIYGFSEALSLLRNSLLLVPVKRCCVDTVYWTMRVEMFFYVLIILMLLARQFSRLSMLAVALTASSGAYLICVWLLQAKLVGYIPFFWTLYSYSVTALIRHGTFFAVGIWLWRATQGPLTPLQKLAALAAVAFGSLEIALRGVELGFEAPTVSTQALWIPVGLWLAAVAIMYRSTQLNWVPRSALVASAIKTAGNMTYPFYLVHSAAGVGLMVVLIREGVAVWLAPFIALAVAALIAYAVSAHWEPFVRSKLTWLFDELLEPAARRLGGEALERLSRWPKRFLSVQRGLKERFLAVGGRRKRMAVAYVGAAGTVAEEGQDLGP